jgi:tetratricopeptide (TPR) repeat protein
MKAMQVRERRKDPFGAGTGRMTQIALSILVLSIALIAMRLALAGAPAVDRSARQDGAFGDWRVPDGRALYLAPNYLYQLGYGYLQADAMASRVTEPPDEVADTATAQRRARRAEALFEESLRLAPASARTWAALAWARALHGDVEGAEAALVVSWAIAPWSGNLAAERFALAEVLQHLDPARRDWPEAWRAGRARDGDTLARFQPRALRTLQRTGEGAGG